MAPFTPPAGHGTAAARRILLAFAVALVSLAALPVPAGASDHVTLVAGVSGQDMAAADENDPLTLQPGRPLPIELAITNRGTAPIQVRTVRLAGKVIGLTFFGYETTVSISVPPSATVTRQFSLDLAGLAGQAVGLLPASISLLDPDRNELASETLIVDVRGSLRSVYGFFGVAIVVLTGVSLAGAFLALARHRLPANRWRRAQRFLPGGIGLGLAFVFVFSVLRVFAPQASRWVPILLVLSAGLFAVGYFTPTPEPVGVQPRLSGPESDALPPDDGRTTRRPTPMH